MRWIFQIVLFVLFVGMASSAFAQDAQADSGEKEPTVYDFSGDTVTGALLRPNGDLVTGQRHGKQSSLIDIRADFIPEMVHSVHDL